jgi:hypothetical protein
MYLIYKIILITCLKTLRVQGILKSGFKFKVCKFLYSVDRLAQSAIFENLLESN